MQQQGKHVRSIYKHAYRACGLAFALVASNPANAGSRIFSPLSLSDDGNIECGVYIPEIKENESDKIYQETGVLCQNQSQHAALRFTGMATYSQNDGFIYGLSTTFNHGSGLQFALSLQHYETGDAVNYLASLSYVKKWNSGYAVTAQLSQNEKSEDDLSPKKEIVVGLTKVTSSNLVGGLSIKQTDQDDYNNTEYQITLSTKDPVKIGTVKFYSSASVEHFPDHSDSTVFSGNLTLRF